MKRRISVAVWTMSIALCAMTSQAVAQNMRVLGGFSNQLQNTAIEKPFFENLEKTSGGKIKAQFRFIDEVGLKGYDGVRQLQAGIFQVMAISPGYVAGDDPFILGVDLPGIALELSTARKTADAYRAALDERLQQKFGGKLLAIWPYPGQVFFCKGTVSGLDGLKGKKVRVFSPALAALVEQFGATPVTLPFSEVYQGLQRGVVDCAISASLSGNTAKWFEVTDHLYPLVVSWGMQTHAANLEFWKGLQAEQRRLLEKEFNGMEERMWSIAEAATQDGVNCNTGAGRCERGTPAKMKLVAVSDADRTRMKAAAEKAVLPKWAADCKRTYSSCAQVWTGTIGKVVGLSLN
jgi:TRAP-type C4-dicarboxylate transport system substrate-binding protein